MLVWRSSRQKKRNNTACSAKLSGAQNRPPRKNLSDASSAQKPVSSNTEETPIRVYQSRGFQRAPPSQLKAWKHAIPSRRKRGWARNETSSSLTMRTRSLAAARKRKKRRPGMDDIHPDEWKRDIPHKNISDDPLVEGKGKREPKLDDIHPDEWNVIFYETALTMGCMRLVQGMERNDP